jgi:hypothetical protein
VQTQILSFLYAQMPRGFHLFNDLQKNAAEFVHIIFSLSPFWVREAAQII